MHQNRPFIPSLSIKTAIAIFGMLAAGCSTTSSLKQIKEPFANAQFEKVERNFTTLAYPSRPSSGKPDFQKDAALYHLMNAYRLHAAGSFSQAVENYQLALTAIDYYKYKSALENLENLPIEEPSLGFAGQMYERLLAWLYQAIAQIHCGQTQASQESLHKHEQVSELLQDSLQQVDFLSHIHLQPNAIAKYLLACQLEQASQLDQAQALYQTVQQLTQASFASNDVIQAGKRSKKAWLVVLVHKGLVPSKKSTYVVAATASSLALEAFLKGKKPDPAWTTITGLAVPYYQENSNKAPTLDVCVDSELLSFYPGYNVAKAARSELNQTLPVMAAKTLARQITKHGHIHKHFTKQRPSASADLLFLLANINSRADTRCWDLLPNSIDFTRIDLDPGRHTLSLNTQTEIELNLKPGLNLIEVFAPDACWLQADPGLRKAAQEN